MKCEYCDNEVPMDATRCPSCGAMVSQTAPMFVQQQHTDIPSHARDVTGNAPSSFPSRNAMQTIDLKSKWAFVLLGIFLGEFGVHNFYLGYIGRGIAKLLITIMSFGLLCWISWIWGIVEVCTVRMDAKGLPLES